jgi:hypothetical protein
VTLRTAGPSLAQLPDDVIVTAADVARYLGVSVRTIIRAGIPCLRVTPRTPRYRVGDLRAWIRQQTQAVA